MNCGIASDQDETVVGERGEEAPVLCSDTDDLISRTAEVRDPYARWCGRGEAARLPPIPIKPQ